MVLGRDIYGFLRYLNIPLDGVRDAVQRRLGIDLAQHEGAYWGEYFFWDGGEGGAVRNVTVFENIEEDGLGEIYAGYSPLIKVRCELRAAADAVQQKLVDIPNLVVLRRFGARLRAFKDCEDRVSFDLVETDESAEDAQVRKSIVLGFQDLMRIVELDPDDDLIGVFELSTEQCDRLCRHVDVAILPGRLYGIDLDTVARLPWVRATR